MKKIRPLIATILFIGAIALFNPVKANNLSYEIKYTSKSDLKLPKVVFFAEKPIHIIYLWTTCPDGVAMTVGNIGLTDSGQLIGYMYWGEAMACEGHQASPWIW